MPRGQRISELMAKLGVAEDEQDDFAIMFAALLTINSVSDKVFDETLAQMAQD